MYLALYHVEGTKSVVTAKQHQDAVNSIEAMLSAFQDRKAMAMAPAWRPEADSTIAIEVTQLKMGNDNGYGKYPIVVGKNMDNGATVAIHAFHTLLREQLAELKCKPGGRYIISYLGLVDKNKPNAKGEIEQYHAYYSEELTLDNAPVQAVEEGFSFD